MYCEILADLAGNKPHIKGATTTISKIPSVCVSVSWLDGRWSTGPLHTPDIILVEASANSAMKRCQLPRDRVLLPNRDYTMGALEKTAERSERSIGGTWAGQVGQGHSPAGVRMQVHIPVHCYRYKSSRRPGGITRSLPVNDHSTKSGRSTHSRRPQLQPFHRKRRAQGNYGARERPERARAHVLHLRGDSSRVVLMYSFIIQLVKIKIRQPTNRMNVVRMKLLSHIVKLYILSS